jgi:peptidoglycan/xylan/chitin deacetylase (PgdA/CDA1 family)
MTKRLIKILISIFVYIFDYAIKYIKSITGLKQPSTSVVIYYHVVKPEHREKFAKQLDILCRLARPLFADRTQIIIDRYNYVAVTFDDGYAGIIQTALPELISRNIPATIFVPSECIGCHPSWIDKESDEYREVVMTEEQLRSLDANYISIGSHCMTHQSLLNLSYQEAKNEIVESKKKLEEILNRKIESLSFPHGEFNESHVKLAHQAGYKRVYSILPTYAFSTPSEFVTGRVRVDPTDWPLEYRLKILGAYRWQAFLHKVKEYI